MVVVPSLELLVFYFLLTKPASRRIEDQHKGDDVVDDLPPLKNFTEKIVYIKSLVHYMIPLGLVYFFEYLINQGLFEMVYFPDVFLTHPQQYQWYANFLLIKSLTKIINIFNLGIKSRIKLVFSFHGLQ